MPMPLSTTSTVIPSATVTRTVTPPCSVNLRALLTRLVSTWRRRVGSPVTITSRSATALRHKPLRSAMGASISSTASTHSTRLKSRASNSTAPASNLEKSRISLMIASNVSPLPRMVFTKSACSGVRGESRRRSAIPTTAFIGVRISWLMLAKKVLLSLAAASAICRASSKTRFCSASSAAR